ncbi:MAG: hypothetical protein H7Y13_10540 [Sphingobacteriaceae bacterium]|nr:hypothetical protein [Sphingobacteriaceae bacterium]
MISLGSSCKKNIIGDDDKLSVSRTPYASNELRTDGYYYLNINSSYSSILFFYKNGIVLSAGGIFSKETEMDSYINKEFLQTQSYKNSKISWGVFKISSNNNIVFERWYPSSGGPLKSYIRSGVIIDNTTFTITKSIRSNGEEGRDINETYHFKQFSPKPDSTNTFVP